MTRILGENRVQEWSIWGNTNS